MFGRKKLSIISDPSVVEIEELIDKKETFLLHIGKGNLMEYCSQIETIIEKKGMSCRIRTKNRTAVNAGALLTGVGLLGFAAQIGHNIGTFNPNWEIIRNPLNNQIKVDYCPGLFGNKKI